MGNSENDMKLAWLFMKKASNDLKSAKILLEEEQHADSTYHSQQCAEKITKTFLILEDNFVTDHRVVKILRKVMKNKFEINPEFRKILKNIRELEKHWIKPRYPFIGKKLIWDPEKEYTKEIAKEALEKAEFVFNTLKEFLKEEYDFNYDENDD